MRVSSAVSKSLTRAQASMFYAKLLPIWLPKRARSTISSYFVWPCGFTYNFICPAASRKFADHHKRLSFFNNYSPSPGPAHLIILGLILTTFCTELPHFKYRELELTKMYRKKCLQDSHGSRFLPPSTFLYYLCIGFLFRWCLPISPYVNSTRPYTIAPSSMDDSPS